MPLHNASEDIEDANDPITAEEITGEAEADISQSATGLPLHKRPSAFTELMSSTKKVKPASPTSPRKSRSNTVPAARKAWNPRDGLLEYIEHPEANPEGRVVEYDDDFVVINDKYPKATVHLLLLPRSPAFYNDHPLELLSSNPDFLTKVRDRVARLKSLAASELRRQNGSHSASDQPYETALEALMSSANPPSPEQRAALPPGRDWASEIKAGVHTHPSMNHMHIHILSRDMHSPCMKHKKHYLSFNTSFLVSLEEFPLEEGSARFHPGNWPNWDLECWRCGQNFRNKFAAFKEHLAEEFEAWRKV